MINCLLRLMSHFCILGDPASANSREDFVFTSSNHAISDLSMKFPAIVRLTPSVMSQLLILATLGNFGTEIFRTPLQR